MILIISSPTDLSTNDVIDWLLYYNLPFLRISEEDTWQYELLEIEKSIKIGMTINGKRYSFDQISCIWYRRSIINVSAPINFDNLQIDSKFKKPIERHLRQEMHIVHEFMQASYKDKFVLNKFSDNYLNKLFVLKKASQIGFNIPETIVTSSKCDLIDFFKRHKKIITKNISPGVFISSNDIVFNGITEIVTEEMLAETPDTFAYSLFQELIQKWIELRIFYLNKKYFAVAIFSQEDEKTKVDFRNYNFERPNRTPPFKIPRVLKSKLDILMDTLDLKSGSIDMILTPEDKFVFLEINPIGLFTQVSEPSNSYIEKHIAEYLQRHEEKFI